MSVDGIPGTSTYTPTVGNDLAWQQAEEARRRAEQAAREAAERARQAAEAARKAAEAARKKAEESRKAAEAAEAKAAKSKEKADQEAAKAARTQADKDELDALHKEAVDNLRDKEKTLANSKVDDLVKHRPVNAPSDATVTAEKEVSAAKKTVALYEPVDCVPAPAAAASAKTNDLLKKAQDAGKVVFELQAKGKKPSDAQVKAANDAVSEWLDSADQDMRTAGASATAHGEDPNKAIKAEYDKIMKDLDDGGVFNPDAFRKYVAQGRDEVLAESPQMRELKAEQHNALSDGAQQLETARADAKTADADATRAEKYAAGFTHASTDSQVDAQQAAKAEALRLRALADGADAKVHQLETLYEGTPNKTDPRLSVPGTVTADYDQRIADLDVKELGAKVATAKANNDQKTLDTLQPQLDQAINAQTLAHAAKDAADTGVTITNLQANQKDAQAAYDAAKAHQPALKTVTGYSRAGKYTYKVEPDGYDKTFWLDYNNPDDRKRVQKIDGKYYLVEDQPLWFDDKKTELNPDAARLWEANEQLANAKTKADAASTKFKTTVSDLLGEGDGVPGKLDTGPWLANSKKIGDDLSKANTDAATAQKNLIDGINKGSSPADLAKLRAQVGTAMETQAAAQAKADALKAMQDLQDARRTRALGGEVSDDKMTKLENDAAAAYKKVLDAQPKVNADRENKVRTQLLPDAKKALSDADTDVATAKFDVDHCAPSEVAAKQKILDDATAERDKLALQVEDYNATLGTIDAKRAGLSAKWEYDHTAFAKPKLIMYADSQGNGISADEYPANYDPTYDILPGKVPEGAHVRFICDHWEVTFDKDSKVMGVNADKYHTPYTIKAGTYTMNPTTARVWETTNPDRSIGGSMATRAEDVRKNLDLVLPKQPSTQIGLDGKPTPTLNLTDDMAAAKKDLQKDISALKDKQTNLQNRIDFGDSASPELKNQIDAAQIDIDIANSQLHAIDTILQWQEANRTLQQYNADIRAGKAVSQPSGKSYQEIADDLANKAVDAHQQWLTTRDAKYIDGAKTRVADAQAAHDKWKADNPLLAGHESSSDTWKTLQSAKADLDRGYRFRALDANEGATTAQQAYITANLNPAEADDPHAMYRLFMNNPQVMAQTIINQHYVQYGAEPIEMDGRTRISNEVGIALGWKPSIELDPKDPSRTEEIKQSQDLFGNLADEQKKLHNATVDKIIELGGDRARVTVLPVVYALDDDHGGIVKTALFKVERGGGQPAKYVDEQGHEYKDLDDYRANNSLPADDVNLAMPSDGKFTLDDRGNVKLFTGDARTEGGFEKFRRKSHFDMIVGGIGLVAGVVLTVGSLGTLSVPGGALMLASGSLMAAGAYGVVTSAMSLQNQAEHGVSVNPFKNEQARMEWVNLGLSAASIPVVGASGRALQLAMKARNSMTLAEKAAKVGDAAAFAEHVSDAQVLMARSAAIGKPASIAAKPLGWGSGAAMADGARNLVQNWDHMSSGERSEQLGMLGLNAAGFASPVFAKGYVRVHTGIQERIASFGNKGATTGTTRPTGTGFEEPVAGEPLGASAEHPVLQAQQGADGVWRVVGLDEPGTLPVRTTTGQTGDPTVVPAGTQTTAGKAPGNTVAIPTGKDVVPTFSNPAEVSLPRGSVPEALTPFMTWMQSDPAVSINAPRALPGSTARKAITAGSETASKPITEHQQLHSPHAQDHAKAASATQALHAKGAAKVRTSEGAHGEGETLQEVRAELSPLFRARPQRPTVVGSDSPGPGEALVGRSREQMRDAAAKIIRDSGPSGPLWFLLDPSGTALLTHAHFVEARGAMAANIIRNDPHSQLRFLLDANGDFKPMSAISKADRTRAAKLIAKEVAEHGSSPVEFLIYHKGTYKGRFRVGLGHDELMELPQLLEMGHVVSNKSGGREYLMLQGAWENQMRSKSIESPRIGGDVGGQRVIEIGGIAVDPETANMWLNQKLLDPAVLANAPDVVLPGQPQGNAQPVQSSHAPIVNRGTPVPTQATHWNEQVLLRAAQTNEVRDQILVRLKQESPGLKEAQYQDMLALICGREGQRGELHLFNPRLARDYVLKALSALEHRGVQVHIEGYVPVTTPRVNRFQIRSSRPPVLRDSADIANALRGVTEQSHAIAKAIDEGRIEVHLLSRAAYEGTYRAITGKSKPPSAFAKGNRIYLDGSQDAHEVMLHAVHEGTHALDNLNLQGIEPQRRSGSVLTTGDLEARAYYHEIEFAQALGLNSDEHPVLGASLSGRTINAADSMGQVHDHIGIRYADPDRPVAVGRHGDGPSVQYHEDVAAAQPDPAHSPQYRPTEDLSSPVVPLNTQPKTAAAPPASVPAESMVFTTEQWATLLSPWLWNGEVNFGGDRQVYVVNVPNGRTARPLSFTPDDVVAHGTIPAGATDVTWHSGTKADPLIAQTVHELFGKPADGDTHAFVVSTQGPQVLQAGKGLSDVAWVRDPYDAPGVSPALKLGDNYKQVEHGHFQRKGTPGYNDARNYKAFGATKAVTKRTGPGASPEPERFVSRRVATNTRRAPIPMQDLQSLLVVNDIHNHGNVFAHPHYLEQINFIKRMLKGMDKQGLINDRDAQDLKMMISYEMIPYLTRANLGAWQGYTNLDVAEILSLYSHRDDWKILSQYERLPETLREQGLPPSLADNLIPSITGIPTYEGSPFSTGDQLAHLLLHFSKLYPMAGEINGLKELKSQLDGRTNRLDPLRSDRYGETGTYLNNALEKSLDAYRDAGLVTVLHMDYSAMELSVRDGRPVASPGDSRHFFNLMNVLMRLGSHDLSDVPYTDPRYVMTDAEVARIQAKGTVKDPLLLVSAHMGVGNWVRDNAQHAQLVQWASRHPLLEHVNWDSSWLPSIQALLQNPKHSGTMLDVLASGRVFYGGDVTNFQTFEQLAAPWYQQQSMLRALEQRDPQALRTYAGDGFRNLYEQSKPRIDWFRYRAAHDPRYADYIDAMPEERRTDLKNFVADYERQHPGVSPLGTRPNQLIVPAGAATPARLPKVDIGDPQLAAGVHQQVAHGRILVGSRPRDLMGYDANDRLILPDGAKPAGQVGPNTKTTTQPAKPQTVRAYQRKGPFNLEQLSRLRDPDGNPYTPEALQAADAAGKAGAQRSMQLTTLLATEFVTLRQNDVNAALEAQGQRQMKQIFTLLGASGLAMLGGGAIAMDAGLLTPWVSAAALTERGAQGLLRTGHQQINRKVSEGFQEEGIVTQEMLDFMASRLAKWGPRSALAEERFAGPQGLAEAVAQAKTDLHYLLTQKINDQAGETQDTRHAILQSEATSWIPRFDRAAGATTSGIEPTNFRTPLGRSISGVTALAYQVGFWGSLQGLADHPSPLHATALAALALGNGALSGYHLTGAVSGQFGRNLTELPLFRRLSGLGAYPALAVGNAALFGDSSIAGWQAAAQGRPVEAALHFSQAFMSGVLAGATGYLSRAGFRAEFGLPPIKFAKQKLFGSQEGHWSDAGHVDKPRSTPKATILAASGLIGLALVTVLQEMFGDEKKGAKPGVTPGGPGLTPTPTSSLTPTPTPSTSSTPATTPTPTATPTPTSTPSPKPRPIFVTVDSHDRNAASLSAIAGKHTDTLLTDAQRASLKDHNAQAQEALAKLMQINPQRGFRPELIDGRASSVAGDPDTLEDGWKLNVNAAAS